MRRVQLRGRQRSRWALLIALVCLAAEEGRDVEVFLVRGGVRVAPHLGDPAAPFLAGLGRAARPLRYLDDLGAGPGDIPALGEAGRDHRDAHLVLEHGIDHRAEDDIGLLVSGFLDDARRLLDLVDGQVRAPGEVDEDAPGALDRGVVEQRARHRLLRGVDRAVLAPARTGAVSYTHLRAHE